MSEAEENGLAHKSGGATGYAESIYLDSQPVPAIFFAALAAGDPDMTNVKQYLSDKDTSERYAVTRQTIWRWVREGKFPHPVKFHGITRWKLQDLEQWEAQWEAKREGQA